MTEPHPSDRAIRQFSPVTGYALDKALAPLRERIAALEARVRALEPKPLPSPYWHDDDPTTGAEATT